MVSVKIAARADAEDQAADQREGAVVGHEPCAGGQVVQSMDRRQDEDGQALSVGCVGGGEPCGAENGVAAPAAPP